LLHFLADFSRIFTEKGSLAMTERMPGAWDVAILE